MSIKHVFSNAIADGTNTQIVRPSDWNSNHNIIYALSGNTVGSSQVSGQDVTWQGGNNITLSADTAGSKLIISGPNVSQYLTTAAQSNHSHNVATTTTNGSLVVIATTNSAGATLAIPPYLTTAQSPGAYLTTAAQSNHSHNFATTTTNGSLIVVATTNSAGATIAVPPYLTTAQAPGAYLTTARASNDAVGLNTALTAGPLAWSVNSSGISLNAGSVAGTTSGFTGGASISGSMTHNTAGLAVSLAHPAWITTAMQSNAATISNINVSAGTTSNLLSAVTFSNGGGVSFGLNAGTITATVATNYQSQGAYLTTAMQSDAATISNINVSAGTTSNNLSALTFSNGSGVSFGLNGSVLTATVKTDYLTTAALSNHSHGNPQLNLTNLSGTTASNSAGFTLSLSANAPSAGVGVEVGTRTATTAGNLRFETGNGITFGLDAVGGSVLTASHNALTTAAQSDHSHGNPTLALTNLSGTTASASNGLTISLSAAAPGAGGGMGMSAGTQSVSTGTMVFANSNNITFGMSDSNQITASFNPINIGMSTNGNTAGTTGTFDGAGLQYILIGGPNVTLSQSSNGSSVSLSISAPDAVTLSQWNNKQGFLGSAGTAQGNSLVSICPFRLDAPVVASNFQVAGSFNVGSAGNNSSAYADVTLSAVVYTRNASTLSSLFSFSNSMTMTWSSNNTGTVTGVHEMTATFAGRTITPGDYWLALHLSTTNTATGGANTTALTHAISMILAGSYHTAALALKPWNGQSADSLGLISGQGIISTGATRATIGFANYTMTGTRGSLAGIYFGLRNATYH